MNNPSRKPVQVTSKTYVFAAPVRSFALRLSLLIATLSLLWPAPLQAAKSPRPPSAPSNLSASAASSSQVNLTWTDKSSNESGFNVQRGSTSSGPWSQIASVGANVTSYANTGLSASTTYYYKVCAYNSRGASAYTSVASATTLVGAPPPDTTSPAVSLTAPANGSTVSGTITLSATASDNAGVSKVEFYCDGVLVSTATVAPYTASYNTTWLANGPHSFSAKAYDAANNIGNSAISTTTVSNADTTAPSVSLTSPANGGTVSGTITLSATASDNVGVSKVEFYCDGALMSTATVAPYTASYNTTWLANATHSFSAKAYDAANNTGNSAISTTTVSNADTMAPSVSLTSPANGGTVSGTTTLSATASDNVGVSKVEFYRDGTVLVGTLTAAPYNLALNTTTVGNGSHTFFAKAYDAANNARTSTTSTVTVNNPDTTTPIVSLTAPINGGTVSGTITLSATAADNIGVTKVEFYRDTTVLVGTVAAAPYSLSFDTATVANGSHSFFAKAYDAAGNVGSSATDAATINNPTADTTPPAVSLTAPSSGSTISGTVTLTAAASDNVGVSKVEFWCDGTTLCATATASPFSASDDTTHMSNGSHTYVAKAYDAAGNSTSSAGSTVTVNNTTIAPGGPWVQGFGGTGTDTGLATAADSSGNVVMAGHFSSTADFGAGARNTAGGEDIVVAKYSASGAHLWSKTFGSAASDRANSVAIDGAGNVFVTGYFNNQINLGGTTLTSAGGRDLFLVKYSSSGAHLWSKKIGDIGDEIAYRVAVDGSGDVVVTGFFKGTTDFGGGALSSTYGGLDTFVAKFSGADGSHIWSRKFTSNSDDIGYGIAVDSRGDVLVSGVFMAKIDLGGGILTSAGGYDIFLMKLGGVAGAFQWGQRFGGTIDDYGYAVAVDKADNVLLTGFFNSSVSFGGAALSNFGGADAFITKFSPTGAHLWSKNIGGIGSDTANGIACDANNNVIVTGSFTYTGNFGGISLASLGAVDGYVAKYASNGSYVWAERMGGTSNGVGNGVAVDSQGHVFATGYFQGTTDFGGVSLTSPGTYDSNSFLLRLEP